MSDTHIDYVRDQRGGIIHDNEGKPLWSVRNQPLSDGTVRIRSDQYTLDQIRQIVCEEVQKALHPEPVLSSYDVSRFLQVECTDQDGKRWRGLLYAVEEV